MITVKYNSNKIGRIGKIIIVVSNSNGYEKTILRIKGQSFLGQNVVCRLSFSMFWNHMPPCLLRQTRLWLGLKSKLLAARFAPCSNRRTFALRQTATAFYSPLRYRTPHWGLLLFSADAIEKVHWTFPSPDAIVITQKGRSYCAGESVSISFPPKGRRKHIT